ncbi:MAG: insulinase family protein, partial [Chitinophagaceae bacterium]|nr:insulinase family protein [Chitinophagaceae bacterium]
ETKAAYEASKNEPDNLVDEKLSKLTTGYPVGHPFYAANTDESLAALSKVTLEDVKEYYTEFYGGNNSVSTFVGELDKKQIIAFLENTFGKWNSKASYAAIEPKHFEVKGATETINTPDKTNAVLLGAVNLNISRKHPDYPAVVMANDILGGGAFLSSRISNRLREKEGMSYGAGSYISVQPKYNTGTWGVYAYFNPSYKGRLDSALHQEIDKALKDGFTENELKLAIGSFKEQMKSTLGANENLAGLIQSYMLNDRTLDEYEQFQSKVNLLTIDAVNATLRKYFDKSKLITVFGGDFEKGKATEKPADKKGF